MSTESNPSMSVILNTSLPPSNATFGKAATPAPPYAASTYYVIITSSGTPATTWTTAAPAWSVSGIAGSTVTSAGVGSDTSASIYLNIGALAGTTRTNLTLTDATSGGSVNILVTPASLLVSDNWAGAAPNLIGHAATYPSTNAPVWANHVVSGQVNMTSNIPYNIIDDGTGHLRPNYQADNFWYSLDPLNGQPVISSNTNSFINSGIYNRQTVGGGSAANPEIGWGIYMDEVNGNAFWLSYNSQSQRFNIVIIQSGAASGLINNTNINIIDYAQGTLTPIQFGVLDNGDNSLVVWAMLGSQFVTVPINIAFTVGKFGLLGYQNNNTGGNFGQQYSIAPLSIAQAQVAAAGHIIKSNGQFCALGSNSGEFDVIATPPGCVFGTGVTDAITLNDGTAAGSFKNLNGTALTPIVLSDSNPLGQFRYAPARLTGTPIVASGVSSNSVTMTPSAPILYCSYDPIAPVGANAPQIAAPPLTGMTPYATSSKAGVNAAQAYTQYWSSGGGPSAGSPQVWGCDLGNLTSAQKAKVLVRIESAMAEGAHDVAGLYNSAPDASVVNYTLEINTVDAPGTPPSDTSSNWIACPATVTPTDYFVPDPNTVVNNNWRVQIHTADMTGANWFRVRCTAGYGNQRDGNGVYLAGMHIEFYDISRFSTLHDWETGFAGHVFLADSVGDNSLSFVPGNAYASAFAAKGYFPVITQLTFPGAHTYDFLQSGAGYDTFQRAMKRTPGRFVNIALATNDLSSYPANVNCIGGLEGLAIMAMMAGKVAVVCTPPYASRGGPSPAGQALNANLDDTTQLPAAGLTGPRLGNQILTLYPSQRSWWLAGPDEETYFRNNPNEMNASDIHPTTPNNRVPGYPIGAASWLSNWQASDSANIYNVQAQSSSPTVTSVTVTPSAPSVPGLGTQQFTAVVAGTNSPAQTVTWSVLSGVGSVNSSGLYTAPASTGSAQNAVVKAISTLDTSKYGTATVTVPAVTITISGATSGNDGSVVALSASGGTAPYAWTTDAGTITSGGNLTLPGSGTGTAHVGATDATGAIGTYSVTFAPASSTVTSVSVTPQAPSVVGRATQQFIATISGTNSPSQSVTWSLFSGVGSINSSGLYTAPNATGSAQAAVVKATSAQDAGKSGTASLAIPAVTVTISGPTSGLDGTVVALSATGGTAYAWAANAGTITSSGSLTLPSTGAGTVQVTATDTTGAFATYNVSYAPPVSTVAGVTISPATVTLAGAATQQFTAVVSGPNSPSQSVTWSLASGGGGINGSGLYTAPNATGSDQTATVQAISVQDGSKSGTAGVTISASAGSGLTSGQAAQLATVYGFINTLHQTGAGLLKTEVDAYATGQDPATLLKADSDFKTLLAASNGQYTFSAPGSYPGLGILTLKNKVGDTTLAVITLTYDLNKNLVARSVV